ncbi:MAG: putative DNA-binding domain-containing protein [Thermoanaerobaculales bacterium]
MPHEARTEAAVADRVLKINSHRRGGPRRSSALRIAPEGGAAPAHEFPLDTVQRWLQAVIVHPGDVEEAIGSPEAAQEVAPERLPELVKPSHSLTSAERVDIYHGMYLLRMVEALESDYPAVRHFLGEEAFEQFAAEYVQTFPSRSYTLNRLGDHVPEFFADDPDRADAAFLHDLSSAELAITEVFDEEETPVLTAEQAAKLPQHAWASARLRPIAALRLLALRYPVTAFFDAYKNDRSAPRPRRRASWLVVYRQKYSVLRLELSRTEHDLLAALIAGTPLGEAVAAAGLQLRASRREASVFRWFRTWIAEGMFAAIEA